MIEGKVRAFVWLMILVAFISIYFAFAPHLLLPINAKVITPTGEIVSQSLPPSLLYLTTLTIFIPIFFIVFIIYKIYSEWRS